MTRPLIRIITMVVVAAGLVCSTGRLARGQAQSGAARHVIVVTIDGLRWQEFFGGAQRDYFKRDKKGSGGEPEARFWRETVEARRQALMPFLWSTVARTGEIFGDAESDSLAHVTNGLWFSYPGYNEMFAGLADPRIDSNDKKPNPNVTVLEWLNRRPGFEGRVAAFGSWDVLPFILNAERSGLSVGSGWNPVPVRLGEADRPIMDITADLPRYWDYGPFDAPIVYAALNHWNVRKPRALYLMLGEGDEWAHEGRYDLYLDATRRADHFIAALWQAAQDRDRAEGSQTSLIVTTDHGRGETTKDWTDHGRDVPAAERTWIAMMGPGVAPLGVRRGVTVTTAQIAATIAAAVGEDFRSAAPAAAPALPVK